MFELSDLTLPIIQAPMAGGISSPSLASAVSNFGGVGSFGLLIALRKRSIRP